MTESSAPETGESPAGLAGMLLAEQPISELLQKILDVAVTTIEAIGAASVTLAVSEPPGYRTVSSSDHSARSLDEVQYCEGGGPCVTAVVTSGEVVTSLPNPDWKAFSAASVAAGYRSVWSIPLGAEGMTAGSLNLYSTAPEPWDAVSTRTARLISGQAQVLLANAMALARTEQANATLRRALETRTVIGQAQGVIMARQNISADDAFDILRRASQRTNRKLREIAAEIVASVTPEGCS